MDGYTGRILRVDLSQERVEEEILDRSIARKYIGGRGLAARILYDELKPGVDALESENKLVFATGPLENTPVPGGARFVVCSKSPLTGGWGEANAAGWFGPMMKRAGYDAIIIEGKAEKPVYLWVSDEGSEIRDATHLWGANTGQTLDAIRGESHERAEVAAIGIAGENMVPYACVVSNCHHVAGRTGMGAVMGAKRLKAVAAHGKRRTGIYDSDGLKALCRAMIEKLKSYPMSQMLRRYGTAGGVEGQNALGMLPVRNFQEGYSAMGLVEKIGGEAMSATMLVGTESCPNCPIRCHRLVRTDDEFCGSVDPRYGGPEYETIGALGPLLGNFDLKAIARANQLCNMFGLDTLNTGVTIAWAMECFEKGIINKQDTGGLELTWGNRRAILALVERIAKREGFGDILADRFDNLTATYGKGSRDFAMHVKNLAFPVHMPRGKVGQGLSFATSNRGACHLQGIHDTTLESGNIMPELGIGTELGGLSRLACESKPRFEKAAQDWRAVQDCLIICKFIPWDYGPIAPSDVAQTLRAVTGWEFTPRDLMTVGERAFNLCRLFNSRENFSREHDTLPKRVGESLPKGPTKGSSITRSDLDAMLSEYYRLRGWDQNGTPETQKLRELGLL